MVKNLPVNAGDAGSISGPGRSPEGGYGKPLQYSCLGNPTDRGAWWAPVHGVIEDGIEQLNNEKKEVALETALSATSAIQRLYTALTYLYVKLFTTDDPDFEHSLEILRALLALHYYDKALVLKFWL